MKRRFRKKVGLLTAAAYMMSVVSPSVYAEENMSYIGEITDIISVSDDTDIGLTDDELLLGYFEKQLYGDSGISLYGRSAYSSLTDSQKAIYDGLLPTIKKIAAGEESSTDILVSETITILYSDIGLAENTNDSTAISTAVSNALRDDFSKIYTALLYDNPYDMYWHDKTIGVKRSYLLSYDSAQDSVKLENITFSFSPSSEYIGDTELSVNTSATSAAALAARNANTIVNSNSGKSPIQRLTAYKEKVCVLVEYDHDAAETNDTSTVGIDPWQVIHVFDNDPDTNVVCEGYSKAMQYLCDLDGGIDCISVSGDTGGGHMWNVVSMDGKNYLVDVTNCDGNAIGNPDNLFMKGMTKTGSYTYTKTINANNKITYTYDADMIDLFGSARLELSSTDYDESAAAEHIHNWSSDWSGDSSYHWHECLNDGCTINVNSQKSGYRMHIFSANPIASALKSKATTESPAIYYNNCSCGALSDSTFTYGEKLHSHNWSSEWSNSFYYHWHECLNDGCDITERTEKDSFGTHVYEAKVVDYALKSAATTTSPAIYYKSCMCGYIDMTDTFTYGEMLHPHNWSADWTYNASAHWHECLNDGCDVTANSEKDGYGTHVYEEIVADHTLKSAATTTSPAIYYKSCECGYKNLTDTFTYGEKLHYHNWSSAWTNNLSAHWHECLADDCNITDNSKKNGYSTHVYEEIVADYALKSAATATSPAIYYKSCKCGKTSLAAFTYGEKLHSHNWSSAWTYDASAHWHECLTDGCNITTNSGKNGYGTHVYEEIVADYALKSAATATSPAIYYKSCKCGRRNTTDTFTYDEKLHYHNWSSAWTYDTSAHWHECLTGGCNITANSGKNGYGTHVYEEIVADYALKSAATATSPAIYYKSCKCGSKNLNDTFTYGDKIHSHNWSSAWTYDTSAHWHECLNDGCDITANSGKNGYGTHVYEAIIADYALKSAATATSPAIYYKSCVCGSKNLNDTFTYDEKLHYHNWSSAWTYNTTGHWHECLNDGCDITDYRKKNSYGTHVYEEIVADYALKSAATATSPAIYYKSCKCGKTSLAAFTYGEKLHSHNWSSDWKYNTVGHWHECLNDGCDITINVGKNGYAKHISSGAATTARAETCTVCGYEISPVLSDPVESFVDRLYSILLGRNAEPSGLADWTGKLKSGKATSAEIVYGIAGSQEFANFGLSNEDIVERMYLAMLGRPSDAGGKANWVSGLNNGMTVNGIINGFSGSQEFANICAEYGIKAGSVTNIEPRDRSFGLTSFTARMYTKALGRSYDVNGLNDWTNRYLTGTAEVKDIAYGFIFSKEFLDKNLSDSAYVDTLYRTFFDREADTGGKADWMRKLAGGMSREEVMYGFVGSQECINLVASFGI